MQFYSEALPLHPSYHIFDIEFRTMDWQDQLAYQYRAQDSEFYASFFWKRQVIVY